MMSLLKRESVYRAGGYMLYQGSFESTNGTEDMLSGAIRLGRLS